MDLLADGAQRLGLKLSQEQLARFELYYRELTEWNQRVNLTAIVAYDEMQVKHFLDSLTLAPVLPSQASLRLLDVGTGAGLPGLPLKILYPGMRLTLVDSVAKKTAFLRHLVARLGLDAVEVMTGRAEDLARQEGYRERFEVVVSRGVAALSTLAELTLPFCHLGGIFVAQKKEDVSQEIERAARAIATLGGRVREVRRAEVDGLLQDRVLVIIEKVAPTPSRYPRRAGMPTKRPL